MALVPIISSSKMAISIINLTKEIASVLLKSNLRYHEPQIRKIVSSLEKNGVENSANARKI